MILGHQRAHQPPHVVAALGHQAIVNRNAMRFGLDQHAGPTLGRGLQRLAPRDRHGESLGISSIVPS